ncbi:RluA family pseudouridine synthase [Deinococcus metallilatus]|uniref:Pseudouridine synthase n=1 Tax=Deinococcus metallilatus TaxID=1211322 RepID=A0AAJ5K650_9DEIO|nr:RluA family pseudouridine synthase [Deinococcus metallilatus]MBB5294654.1 23S rRNA pseudouridine1911/1915/1917 synthase [Deinococcus metallilatus]QBY07690.1 RluA family pseudouridine synthase [Deinococcus metallilatus]RXJ14106.1 RluA family pseudouridine synthase [Deinococcus metallilatus]TLK30071.1 RluA family pseudouridine synthase [Deinococcus metallilatus]GMA15868.1 RNA pseudouridine synthase [Deinococcus metallilatus]
MALNGGYTYREELGTRARGLTVLAYLTRHYPHSSEGDWLSRLERGEVSLDGLPAHGPEGLRPGQVLEWRRPPWQEEAVPLHYALIHQDPALLAVAKPSGLPTLPGGGFLNHTLLARVRADFPEARPLHRLGRGTSGLVLFARTHEAGAILARAWREQAVQKRYRALAVGLPSREDYVITTPIGPVPHPRLGSVFAASAPGKAASSHASVLERRAGQTLFAVDIHTGRPHQIRIHLAAIGHPLLGDPLYAPGGLPRADLPGLPGDGGYWLHAERLTFLHPLSGERLSLEAPPPAELRRADGT